MKNLSLLIVLACALAMTGCAGGMKTGQPVRDGASGPLLGSYQEQKKTIAEQSAKTKAAMSAYTTKTTPVGNDTFLISDSEASNATKKATLSSTRAALGLGTADNPSFASVHASGGNLAAANKQVTKAWQTGLSYTADVTSVIHGGKHWIAKTTHTAGSTTEPGVGASYTDAWTEVSGAGDDLGDATSSTIISLFGSGSCSGYLKSDGGCDTPSGAAHNAVTLGTDADVLLGLTDQQLTLDSQTANTFFAAPNGSAGDPTFRALVDGDIPSAIARDSELPTDATITTTDVTTNNAGTTKHGWLIKATAPSSGLRNIVAIDNAETVYKNAALFDATSPSTQAFGDAATVGTAMTSARRDHKHAMPAAPTTITGNAGTATALASNPTDCTAGQYATTIAANGNLTCAQVAYSQISSTPTLGTVAQYNVGTGANNIPQLNSSGELPYTIPQLTSLQTASGISSGATHLGTFTGSIITDGSATIKSALQELETAVGSLSGGGLTSAQIDTSAELDTIVTDDTGSGALVFATSPTLVTPALGTPSSVTLTNATGLPISGLVSSTSAALGLGSVELGHASDTTLARSSAGVVTIEGVTITRTIASGSGVTFDPTSVSSGACSSAVDGGTATGVATTDVIDWGFSSTPIAVTGYNPSGDLGYIIAYPTADHVNFIFCNKSGNAIDPGSVTLNWKVRR